tara:strand:+ start:366 stop:506 length:141 start_codon:yes stop_codon:yes gene_type:complete
MRIAPQRFEGKALQALWATRDQANLAQAGFPSANSEQAGTSRLSIK